MADNKILKYWLYKDDPVIGDQFHKKDGSNNWLIDSETGKYIYTEWWTNNWDKNNADNPYMVATADEIKSYMNTANIYIKFDKVRFQNLINNSSTYVGEIVNNEYIIDYNKLASFNKGRFTVLANVNFDGDGVILKNVYVRENIVIYISWQSNESTSRISNISFLNCHLYSTASRGQFIFLHRNHTAIFTNCNFSFTIYAEFPYFIWWEDYPKNPTFNNCSIYFKPVFQNFNCFDGYIFSNAIVIKNCNIFLDLTKPIGEKQSSFNGIFGPSTEIYNSKIKINFGGNWSGYYRYICIFRNSKIQNNIVELDAYEDFVKFYRLCIYSPIDDDWFYGNSNEGRLFYNSGIFTNDPTWDRNSYITSTLKYTEYSKIVGKTLIINNNLNKFYNESDKIDTKWYISKYCYNYDKSVNLITWLTNNEIPHEIYNSSDYNAAFYLNYNGPRFTIEKIITEYRYDNGYLCAYCPSAHHPDLLVCTKAQSEDETFLLNNYFPLMLESY